MSDKTIIAASDPWLNFKCMGKLSKADKKRLKAQALESSRESPCREFQPELPPQNHEGSPFIKCSASNKKVQPWWKRKKSIRKVEEGTMEDLRSAFPEKYQ